MQRIKYILCVIADIFVPFKYQCNYLYTDKDKWETHSKNGGACCIKVKHHPGEHKTYLEKRYD